MKSLQSLLLILLLTFGFQLWAVPSSYSTHTFDVADGLSSSVALDLHKSSDGQLWIATSKGVDLYDGRYFKHYSLTEGHSEVRSTNDGTQHHFVADPQGPLYCFTDRGKIFRYDADGDDWLQVCSVTHLLARHSMHAAWIEGDRLLIGLYDGIYLMDLPSHKVVAHLVPNYNVHCIIPYKQDTYLIGCDHGVVCLDLKQQRGYSLACPELEIQTLYFDQKQQRLWIGTEGAGILAMDIEGGQPQQLPGWETSIVNQILPLDDTRMLIATDGNGLLVSSRQSLSHLEQIADDSPEAKYELTAAGVRSLLVDDGNIWLSTWGGGITLIRANSSYQCFINRRALSANDYRANDMSLAPDGKLWVAYNKALASFDLQTGASQIYEKRDANLLAVRVTQDGSVWCGGYNSGLYRFDPVSGKFSHLPSVMGGSVNNSIYTLCLDNKQRLWVGGLFMPLTCIPHPDVYRGGAMPSLKEMVSYEPSRINDIAQLNDSLLVLASSNGFILFNMETCEMQNIAGETDTLRWSGTTHIRCVTTDGSHLIYMGTEGSGLMVYDVQSGELETYNSEHGGLPSNYLRGIVLTSDSLLWISTEDRGIFAFHRSRHQVVAQLSHRSGLSSEEFNNHASVLFPDGSVAYGSKAGVELITADCLSETSPKVTIYLSEVGLGQESRISHRNRPDVLDTSLDKLTTIHIPFGERLLRLRFSTNDLYQQHDLMLSYRLNDSRGSWIPLDDSRTVSLYSMPPGQHKLEVRCMSGDGVVAIRELTIDALETPWLRWPALLAYLLFFAGFVFAALVSYIKHLESKAAAEKLRIFESKSNMHEHYLQLILKEAPKTDVPEVEKEEAVTTTALDDQFIAKLMKVMDRYIPQAELNVDDLAREMAMSHSAFYDKVNKLLGMPPASLIRSCRLKRAKEMLEQGDYTIAEVAMKCGFSDAKYFSTAFKKYYGVSPSKL